MDDAIQKIDHMKKLDTTLVAAVLLVLLPPTYLAMVYPSLPNTIPTHFNIEGKADGWGEKTTLVFTCLFMGALSMGLYALLTNISRLDPKKTAGQNPALMKKMGLAVVALLTLVQLSIIESGKGNSAVIDRLIVPGLGLFFAVMGNFMHSIKPNYFAGFRLPWTLEDPENWRLTHQVASKFWVVGGVLVAVGGSLLPLKWSLVLLFAFSFFMVLVPVVYSYRIFSRKKKENS